MKGKRPSGEERGELELLRRRVKQLEAEVSKLEQTEKELARCQDRYRILMEESPIPLWGLDFSQTKQLVDRLWAAGVRDFERRFREHPDDFATLVDGVKARDVNTATLKLYGAETEEELFSVLRRSFKQTPDRADTFAKGVAFLAAGRTSFETEAPVETLKGEEKHLAIRWSVASGCEQTWSRVFISMIDVTERKRAEQGLRESEERCRRLFDTCPDGIVITTREGEFLSANRAYLDMLGRTMEELKQMRSWQFTPAKWAKSEAKAVASLLKAGRGVRVKEYVRKDGTVFPVSLTGWVMKDQENVPLEVGAFVKDITERRRAESELRIKDSAIETSINGIALADLAGTLTYVNPAFLKMWGYDDPGEVVGRPAVSFWENPQQAGQVQQVLVAGANWTGGMVAKRKDGSIFSAHLSASLVRNDSGDPVCLMSSFIDVSERSRAEQRLRESEARYRALVEHIPAAVYTAALDEASTTTYISPQIESLIGCTPAEYEADPDMWRKRIHPEDRARVMQEVARCHATGERFISEYRMVGRDGRVVWVRDEGSTVYDEQGRPLALQGVMSDITDRRQAEEALSQSRERLQYIIDNTSDIIFQIDLEGTYTFANRAAERITGHPLEALLQMNMRELLAPEYRDQMFERLRKRIAGEPVEQPYECELIARDGQRRTLELTTTAIHENRKLVGVQGIARDVTARKEAEKALRASEERFRTLVDNLPVGVYRNTPGPRGRFVMANRAMARLHGYDSLEEFLKIDVAELHDSPAQRQAFSDKLIAEGELAEEEVTLRRRDGSSIWGAVTARVVRDEQGNVQYFDGIVEDITERKRTEEALRESERRMRLILENTTDGVDICERDPKTNRRRLVMCNDRFVEMSGRSREELMAAEDIGKLIRNRTPPEQAEMNHELLLRRQPHQGLASWARPDGKENYYEWTAAPIEVGDKQYLIGIDRDITERIRSEAALREARGKLTTAREEERRRLAAELHDSIGQGLIALRLGLQGMLDLYVKRHGRDDKASVVSRVAEQCDDLIREVRNICHGLYPPTLELGLAPALGELARDFQAQTKVVVQCQLLPEAGRFPDEVEIALFRIAQEGVVNAIRHGRAKTIELELGYEDGHVVLTVRDDGRGFEPAAVVGRGLGLTMMQERAQAVGGTLSIDSGDHGTCIRVSVPATWTAPPAKD